MVKKFIVGMVSGIAISLTIVFSFNLLNVGAEDTVDNGNITEQQSLEMELAWYRHHHETLSKALEGKCE